MERIVKDRGREREMGRRQSDGDQRKTKLPGDLLSRTLLPHSLFPSPLFNGVSEGLKWCASRGKHAIGHLIGWLNNHPVSLQARQGSEVGVSAERTHLSEAPGAGGKARLLLSACLL